METLALKFLTNIKTVFVLAFFLISLELLLLRKTLFSVKNHSHQIFSRYHHLSTLSVFTIFNSFISNTRIVHSFLPLLSLLLSLTALLVTSLLI